MYFFFAKKSRSCKFYKNILRHTSAENFTSKNAFVQLSFYSCREINMKAKHAFFVYTRTGILFLANQSARNVQSATNSTFFFVKFSYSLQEKPPPPPCQRNNYFYSQLKDILLPEFSVSFRKKMRLVASIKITSDRIPQM